MSHFTHPVAFNATHNWDNHTSHALLVCAFNKAQQVKLFSRIEQSLHLKMKKRCYSWSDKIKTLWASIVVGCNHTSEINSKLGSHERAVARMFNLERFPEQSQINRLLWAFDEQQVEKWRRLHLDLLCRHSRATARKRWLMMSNRERLLPIDIDQRGLVVRGKQFELATRGYFSHKRGRVGYQLSLAFMGGPIGEVLDEYLDSGKTPILNRVDDLLNTLEEFCRRTRIPKDCILIRGDAQLGTPAIIERYFYDEQWGLGARQVRTSHFAGEAIFEYIVATTNNLLKWMRHSTFRGTEREKMGVSRIVREAMQIAGKIYKEGSKWIVEMPAEHWLVKQLMKSWKQLRPLPVDT